ncbi:MAG TPA: hypothetical protein VE954_27180 [Oligoflexus sp.]|uniref:hypothetical protein n=1 Tax=Oligoflexus sp. TaxID=1971216 RepID=UPI002D614C47|nr:hypothetical protein [Oligoflexus sp.]HYX36808.1 hypothetical protein [Oligoflexus sp.]
MKDLKKNLPLSTDALRASYGTANLLPIEFFKLQADALRDLISGPVVRTFLSSGTTRADRSQSHFSKAGLETYRRNSVAAFQNILRHFFAEPLHVPGLSLIPDIETWPDSSLAQMVHWIGEEHELQYWDGLGQVPDRPVWVFGTAFHFVNLADDGVHLQLPQGSIVIETGGTKGRSRSVTREELYTLIQEHLGVSRNHIVSEYGMCELSSQAYDFVESPDAPELTLQERWFRFPSTISVSVRDRCSRSQTAGEGTLVVHDTWRIDYPWPIRTEDMALVREDGAFQLLGRVPMSPLKGCSMLAENIAGERKIETSPAAGRLLTAPLSPDRAEHVHRLTRILLDDQEFWNLWRTELYETQAALWLRDDLQHSLPATPQDWIQAATLARGGECPARWLIIPPESHNFAWLYPIFLGTMLGLELYLRARTHDPLVQRVQKLLAPLGGFSIWEAPQRIGVDPMPEVDAVMIFGSDETLAAVRAVCPVPVQGFGTSLAVSLMYQKGDAEKLWKDAFSLLQKGCMSSRVLFLLQDASTEPFQQAFVHTLHHASQPVGELPLGMDLALEHAAFRLRCQGRILQPRPGPGAPLLLLQTFDPQKNLADVLLDRAMSLSLVMVPKFLWAAFAEWLPAQKNLHKIAVHSQDHLPITLDGRRFELALAGNANAPAWNGRHQNRPVFSLG